jgi:predicted DNA-binding transcriptional regulator YafY
MADQIPLTRALRLLRQLGSGNWFTMAQLRNLLETHDSIRTVQRTLSAIEDAGIYLERRTVAHGAHEVRLPSPFRVPNLLSPDEALVALLLSPFAAHLAGSRMGEVLEGMLDKVDQLLPRQGLFAQTDLAELREWVLFSRSNQLAFPNMPSMVLQLLEAIVERRIVHVNYRRQAAVEEHSFAVHPHALVQHQGALYLLAWHPVHENWLHLAVHRMMRVGVIDDGFARQPEFKLADFVNGSFGIWHAEPVYVRLSFDSQVAAHVHERRWHPSQRWDERDDGRLELTMRVGLSPELRAWVLRWGDHVRVEEPAEFREELHRQLWSAAAQYGPPPTSI